MIKIGIPKALLYYEEFILWKTFFSALDTEIILSDSTSKEILDSGLKYSMDDMCLPVKAYTGHVLNLLDKGVDYVFIPRIVSVIEGTYTCPKFMGIPDVIKNAFKRKKDIKILTVKADIHDGKYKIWRNYWEMGLSLGFDSRKVLSALKAMRLISIKISEDKKNGKSMHEISNDFGMRLRVPFPKKEKNPIRIGITGHSYTLYDKGVNMDLFKKLKKLGVEVVTQEMISDDLIEKELKVIENDATEKLPKLVMWNLGQRTQGATFHFLADPAYDGVIHLCAFACGPGSVVGKLIELKAKQDKTNPLLQLNFDEHTAETAVVTRLEAFVDILRLKREKDGKR